MSHVSRSTKMTTLCAALATLTLLCVLMLSGAMLSPADIGGTGQVVMAESVRCGVGDTVTPTQSNWASPRFATMQAFDLAVGVSGDIVQSPPALLGAPPPHLERTPLRI